MRGCLHGDLLRQELCPLLLSPRARDLVRNESIPENRRGDMDAVLAGELDCIEGGAAVARGYVASTATYSYISSSP